MQNEINWDIPSVIKAVFNNFNTGNSQVLQKDYWTKREAIKECMESYSDGNGKLNVNSTVTGQIDVDSADVAAGINASGKLQTITEIVGVYLYTGESTTGVAKSSEGWTISRYNSSTGELAFADNETTPTKVWNNRATYNYTIGA